MKFTDKNFGDEILKILPQLSIRSFVGGEDINLNNPPFEEADFKVCIVHSGDFHAKQSSATFVCLANMIREVGKKLNKKIFIGYHFQLAGKDLQLVRKAGIPESFDWTSFNSFDKFDLLCQTFSIHYECQLPYITWLGTHGAIEPFHKQRLKNPRTPLILAGGIISDLLEPLHGHREGSLIDCALLGDGEDSLDVVIEWLINNPGFNEDKKETIRKIIEFAPNLYYPDGYTHKFEGNRVSEIVKNFDWVQDKVSYHRCFDANKPAFEHRILLTKDDAASRGESQLSHGCSGQGACSFSFADDTLFHTDKGLIPLKHLSVGDKCLSSNGRYESIAAVYDLRDEECLKLTTRGGYSVVVSPDHDLLDLDLNIKLAKDFKVGDVLPWKFQKPVGGNKDNLSLLWLAGFAFGDGYLYEDDQVVFCIGKGNPDAEEIYRAVSSRLKELGVSWRDDDLESEWKLWVSQNSFNQDIRKYLNRKDTLPQALYSLDWESFQAWALGYFMADGTIGKKGYGMSICAGKENLMFELQRLLGYFGIPCAVDVYRYRVVFDVRSAQLLVADASQFIHGRRLERVDRLLGLEGQRTSTWKGFYFRRLMTIANIENVGIRHTMNLTVEPTHHVVVGGGIVSSQCHEGAVAGPWRERSFEKVVSGFDILKKTTAPTIYSGYSYNCTLEDSIVFTETGLTKIQNMSPENKILSRTGIVSFDKVSSQGLKPVKIIETHLGTKAGFTLNHRIPVLTSQGLTEKFVGDLVVGDQIAYRLGHVESLEFDKKAYLCGLHYGYGSHSHKGFIQYFNVKEEELIDFALRYSGYEKAPFDSQPALLRYHVSSFVDAELREIYGGLRKPTGFTPEMWGKSLSWMASFIGGLFDADSGFCGRTLVLTMKEEHEQMIRDIQTVLMRLGIRSLLGSKSTVLNGKLFKSWTLGIHGNESYDNFKRLIGLALSSKVKKLDRASGVGEKDKSFPSDIGLFLKKNSTVYHKDMRKQPSFFFGHSGTSKSGLERALACCPNEEVQSWLDNGLRFTTIKSLEDSEGVVWDLVESGDGHFVSNGLLVHNSNYCSYAFEMYEEVAKNFSGVSVISLRSDILADNPNYIPMLKALGSFRQTSAWEGVSHRIRNHILNKNLSWEQIFRACTAVFEQKHIMLKMNLITTGYEEDADFDEFNQKLDELLAIRDSLGAKTALMFSSTTLVHYPNTAMFYRPRKSTLAEVKRAISIVEMKKARLEGDDSLKSYRPMGRAHDHIYEKGCRIRYNSGPDFIYQQLLVDGARLLTEPLLPIIEAAWKNGENVSGRNVFEDLVSKSFDVLGLLNPDKSYNVPAIEDFFLKEWGYDEITPYSSLGVLAEGARKVQFESWGKKGIPYCLRTVSNPNPKCYMCGYCNDKKEWRDKHLIKREYDLGTRIEDVQKAIFENKPKSAIRVVFKIKDDIISKNHMKVVQTHYLAARFLNASQELADSFFVVTNYSSYQASLHEMEAIWGGYETFDVQFRMDPEELKSFLEKNLNRIVSEVNAQSKLSEIVLVRATSLSSWKMDAATSLWKFKSIVPRQELLERFGKYDGNIIQIDKSGIADVAVKVPYPRENFSLYVVQQAGHTEGYVTLNARFNPLYAAQGLFQFSKVQIRDYLDFSRVSLTEVGHVACKHCERSSGVDIFTGKIQSVCPECQAKVMAIRASKG